MRLNKEPLRLGGGCKATWIGRKCGTLAYKEGECLEYLKYREMACKGFLGVESLKEPPVYTTGLAYIKCTPPLIYMSNRAQRVHP